MTKKATKKTSAKKSSQKKSAVRKRSPQKKTCGDFGGKRPNGNPCTRPAGWGTEKNAGRCKDHSDAAHAKMQSRKKQFLELLESGAFATNTAAKKVGVNHSTIWRWRQSDPGFDEEYKAALAMRDDIRGEIIEDSFFKRCVEGRGSEQGTMFWLKNRLPERWKDRKEITGADGDPIQHQVMFVDPGQIDDPHDWAKQHGGSAGGEAEDA